MLKKIQSNKVRSNLCLSVCLYVWPEIYTTWPICLKFWLRNSVELQECWFNHFSFSRSIFSRLFSIL